MQMHESKASTTRSGSSSSQNQHHQHKLNKSNNNNNHNNNNNNKLPKNQTTDNAQPTPSKKSRSNRNSNRDKQPDNDAKSASVSMSNLSSYSLIEDDHIDDQESINVGNLIIDLESDLEKEKIESEQANNSVIDSNTKSLGSNIGNAPTSTSSATLSSSSSSSSFATTGNNNNNNKATSSTTIPELSNNNKIGPNKSNQKSTNKHSSINSNINANTTNNNGHSTTTTSTRTVFKSSADERGELKMKITRETKPAKNDFNSRPVTSPSQKSPTCSSSNNNNINNHTSHFNNLEDNSPIGELISSRPTQSSSSISSTRECGTSTSVGTITEPECLGPCEPGTSVTLEGIVWQETEGGILVVNVTWRGKTYVGALLDCTRHDWAPPRLCDSPASDIDSKNNKGVRTKRIVTRSNGIGLDEKNLLQTTGKLRNGKGRRIPPTNDPASCAGSKKQQRDSSTEKPVINENQTAQSEGAAASVGPNSNTNTDTNSESPYVLMNIDTTQTNNQQPIKTLDPTSSNIATDKEGPSSPTYIGCSEPNCSKKYTNMTGLSFHQSKAHRNNNDSSSAQDDNCSSSTTKDKSSKPSMEDAEKETATTPEDADGCGGGDGGGDGRSPSPRSSPVNKDDISQRQPNGQKRERTPSPPTSVKMSNNRTFVNEQQQGQLQIQPPSGFYEDPHSVQHHGSSSSSSSTTPRASVVRNLDSERRHSSNLSGNFKPMHPGAELMGGRSPGAAQRTTSDFHGHGSSSSSSNLNVNQQQQPHHHHHSSTSKQSSSSSKQSNIQPPPLPATTEEGMKPSGTSTGPPPAPHQANCYFNSAFLANSFNPYALPSYFPRHMGFDSMMPPGPAPNAAFLSRFMNTMRPAPPPDSPSRLLSPASMPKNLPFPFKLEPGSIPPPPVSTSLANPQLPNMSPLPPPMMGGGSPHLRMPSQGDPMMPPTSQPPFLPPVGGLNPALGLAGMPNPLVGPLGGPQVPSLVDDALAKQFPPRRFN